jgi:hypothetical protein
LDIFYQRYNTAKIAQAGELAKSFFSRGKMGELNSKLRTRYGTGE